MHDNTQSDPDTDSSDSLPLLEGPTAAAEEPLTTSQVNTEGDTTVADFDIDSDEDFPSLHDAARRARSHNAGSGRFDLSYDELHE